MCTKQYVLEALDMLPPFLNSYDPKLYGKLHNPEGLLKATWTRKKLRVQWFSRIMFTCYSEGDHARWTVPEKKDFVPEGVYKKYHHEYGVSKRTCDGINKVKANRKK